MFRYRMPAALAAAMLAASLYPAQAQGTPAAPAQGAQTGPAEPPSPKPVAGTDVVGSVNGKQITWNDLIDNVRKENPPQFSQVVAQVTGPKAAAALFGGSGQPSVTLTQEDVFAAIRQNPPPTMSQALDVMLLQAALNQEAAKQGIMVPDTLVNERISRVLTGLRKKGQIPPGTTDDQFIAQNHLTRDQLMANFRPQTVTLALIEKDMTKSLGHPIGADDFVQARHILIKAPTITSSSSDKDKKADADAKTRIVKIAAEIKSGKITFEQAAKQYTEEPGGKERGGDLGVFTHGMMLPEFDIAVFKLKPGEVSEPVHTMYGYHLIQVTKAGKDIPADQRQDALEARDSQQYRTYLDSLRQRANIVNNLRANQPQPVRPGAPEPQGARN